MRPGSGKPMPRSREGVPIQEPSDPKKPGRAESASPERTGLPEALPMAFRKRYRGSRFYGLTRTLMKRASTGSSGMLARSPLVVGIRGSSSLIQLPVAAATSEL